MSASPSNNAGRRRRRRGIGAGHLLAAACLSGTVCYRLGSFRRCARLWPADLGGAAPPTVPLRSDAAADDDAAAADDIDVDAPAFYPKEADVHRLSAAPPRDDDATRSRNADPDDRRAVARDFLPYDCGIVFFYHIPDTGGASINRWLRGYRKLENVSYYQHWELEVRANGTFHPNPQECEATFAEGVSRHIRDLGPHEWRVAHAHLTNTYLNESEGLLYQWRAAVEAQGCELVNTVMLRDPLSHALSLHKIMRAKNSTRKEWTQYLESPTGPGAWATVLDFFLYNNQGRRERAGYPHGPGGRNPFNVTREAKVARARELLRRHFDVVTVSDHAGLREQVLRLTGWRPTPMPHFNAFPGDLRFTKREVQALQERLRENGDVEFVDRARRDYHGYLSDLDD